MASSSSETSVAANVHVQVLYSQPAVAILSQPYLVNDELSVLSQASNVDFVQSLDLNALVNPVVVEILNGGRYYYLPAAYEQVTGKKPRVASLKAKRRYDSASAGWVVDLKNEQGQFHGGTMLIGDTVATGTTLAGTLDLLVEHMLEAKQALHDIYVFAIAGSSIGVTKGLFNAVAAKLATQGKSLTLVVSNCDFELHENGTDLMFGDVSDAKNVARYNPKALTELTAHCGVIFNDLKCCVWDWGDRFTQPAIHLAELLEHLEHRLTARLTADVPVTAAIEKLQQYIAEIKLRSPQPQS